MNKELQLLYQQDQADRFNIQKLMPEETVQRDRIRLQRVEELRASEALQVPEDYFHAAMIFQHGETLEQYWQAYELAKKGAESGLLSCRWLVAAAYDRWLMKLGKPQMYGTQFISRGGLWILYEIDPTTTDAQRAEWNVPPLAQTLQLVEEMNRMMPPTSIR
jgi:hypothetical protein